MEYSIEVWRKPSSNSWQIGVVLASEPTVMRVLHFEDDRIVADKLARKLRKVRVEGCVQK